MRESFVSVSGNPGDILDVRKNFHKAPWVWNGSGMNQTVDDAGNPVTASIHVVSDNRVDIGFGASQDNQFLLGMLTTSEIFPKVTFKCWHGSDRVRIRKGKQIGR